jgi:hypothetical protein
MAWIVSKQPGRLIGALALIVVCLVAPERPLNAQSHASGSNTGIAGAWLVQVTVRDCTSGTPTGQPFNALVTFHRGGTISESPGQSAFAIGQRGNAHGTWTRRRGHTYSQEMVALILFDTDPNLPTTPGFDPAKPITPGFFAGWQTVSHTVQLAAADHLTSSGTNAFYKANGDLYRSGCSTAVGRRFQ